MENIKETIKRVMQKLQGGQGLSREEEIEKEISRVLTKKEIRHIRINYFKNGVLNIAVDSSSWLYHLNLKRAQILSGISKKVVGVKDVRFRLGEGE